MVIHHPHEYSTDRTVAHKRVHMQLFVAEGLAGQVL